MNPVSENKVIVEVLLEQFDFRRKDATDMIQTILATDNLMKGLVFVEEASTLPHSVQIAVNDSGGEPFVYYGANQEEKYRTFQEFVLNINYSMLQELHLQVDFPEDLDWQQQEVKEAIEELTKKGKETIKQRQEEKQEADFLTNKLIEIVQLENSVKKLDNEIEGAILADDDQLFLQKTKERNQLLNKLKELTE